MCSGVGSVDGTGGMATRGMTTITHMFKTTATTRGAAKMGVRGGDDSELRGSLRRSVEVC